MPDFSLENQLYNSGLVAGVDEVGYGAWAGPVVVAAAILHQQHIPPHLLSTIADSKKLSPTQRHCIYTTFLHHPHYLSWACAHATVEEISMHNVLGATLRAMATAVARLSPAPSAVLVDGRHKPPVSTPVYPIIRGDSRSLSIAVASIMAKVTRDQLMEELGQQFPAFAWARNKGYGTAAHRQALQHHGPTIHHRLTFGPIAMLQKPLS